MDVDGTTIRRLPYWLFYPSWNKLRQFIVAVLPTARRWLDLTFGRVAPFLNGVYFILSYSNAGSLFALSMYSSRGRRNAAGSFSDFVVVYPLALSINFISYQHSTLFRKVSTY